MILKMMMRMMHVYMWVVDDDDYDDGAGDDGDDVDDDHCFQRGRAEPRDPDQEITKSERLHW